MVKVLGLFLFIFWAIFSLMMAPFSIVPNILPTLGKPNSWSEFGDALGSINGILSIISVLIAMYAISKQGKQIKDSIREQHKSNEISNKALEEQIISNKILIKSIEEQQKSNNINALGVAIDTLNRDNDRLEALIQNAKQENNGTVGEKNRKLIDNMNTRKTRNLDEIKKIREKITKIIEEMK